jgi:hypothetical protein
MVSKVLVNPLGWAVIICPDCGVKTITKPEKELQNKVLDRVCTCGAKYQLLFDTDLRIGRDVLCPVFFWQRRTFRLSLKIFPKLELLFLLKIMSTALRLGVFTS